MSMNKTDVMPDDDSHIISRPAVPKNVSNNSNDSPSTPSAPRPDIFGKEISKLQDLMLQNELSYKAQIEELTNSLILIEKKNNECDLRIAEIEGQDLDGYEKKIEELETENTAISDRIAQDSIRNKEILMIIEEYQRSNNKFKAQYDAEELQLEEQIKTLSTERDVAEQLVESIEIDFNSIHQKYEKCKSVMEAFKENEKKIFSLSQESSEKLKLINLLTHDLKEHATGILEKCHEDLSGINKRNKTELAKLQAVMLQLELKCESQGVTITQITNELKETAKMCDGLIGRFQEHHGVSW